MRQANATYIGKVRLPMAIMDLRQMRTGKCWDEKKRELLKDLKVKHDSLVDQMAPMDTYG